jgi:hypothetical protein
MEQGTESFYIAAYNKIDVSIRMYLKFEKEYPSYFDASTAQLLNKLKIEKQNLSIILRMWTDNHTTNKKRMVTITQIQLIVDDLEKDEFTRVAHNQGLMFDNYIFPMIANHLADITYKQRFFNSHQKFIRAHYSDFDHRPLCKLLQAMKRWLNDNSKVNYVDFEKYMDQSLGGIAGLANVQNAA